ncbi:DUF2845 domain-containing protein [Zooshikella ganghwensis]|uniref:DUF2845 domain-containing protein n=1 Tax=Zooshikella ganghwensis TaxID=202772 RepID=A0A4P9VP07_9GAMM|nr:DUF2845 domain-containing protein [Zooshikella ganghwensis]RDH44399.1 DUF2845 domain-containing protein [Zooshikella ganghwensis]
MRIPSKYIFIQILLLIIGMSFLRVGLAKVYCGPYMVKKGLTTAEVKNICGEPMSIDDLGTIIEETKEDKKTKIIRETVVLRWTYGKPGLPFNYITFYNGKVKRIEEGKIMVR